MCGGVGGDRKGEEQGRAYIVKGKGLETEQKIGVEIRRTIWGLGEFWIVTTVGRCKRGVIRPKRVRQVDSRS